MTMGQACLKKGEEKDILAGGLWIYDNELAWVDEFCQDGGIVDVLDSRERFIARGYFNSKSKITIRVLTRQDEEINREFFHKRIAQAWKLRRDLGFENCCRVVFGEADLLPGLTVDKYGDYLSIQTVSLGIEQWKQDIVEILVDLFAPKGIFERNDVPVREKEGLKQQKGCIYGTVPPLVEIQENEARILVDIASGQKTGYFLDQRENRAAIRPYVKDAVVLDCCCHTGSFAVHAGLYGAKEVEAVDVSESALEMAARNAQLNGLTNVKTVCADVFDLLREYTAKGRQFDTIILDPPAFAKSRKALEGAYRGYKEINLHGMKLLKSGGYLITCSCSQFMTPELFYEMLRDAAADSGRVVRLLEQRLQSRDHPAALNAEQSLYLKCYILQVI